MRVSELLSIKISDLNQHNYFLNVMGKGNKERIVPLTEEALGETRHYLDLLGYNRDLAKETYLYPGSRKNRCLTRQYFASELKVYARVRVLTKNISPHVLRHFQVIYCKMEQIYAPYKCLAFRYLNNTNIYAHLRRQVKNGYKGKPSLSKKMI